nr:RICIN domain-containing protein [Streptomyces sp. TML10]
MATLAFQLAPYVTDARRDGAAGRPDTSVSAPVHRTPGASATGAATSPEPGGKGSASPADAKKPGKDSASAGGKGEDGKGGGAGGATDGGSGGGSGSGAASGSGGSASGSGGSGGSGAGGGAGGTGTSAGSGGSGDSGGSAGNAAGGTSTTPDSFRLKNGENGKCLIQVYGSTGLGDCSGETARWTFRSASGGSVKVVNVSTGACLSANGNGQAVFTGDCAQSGSVRLWRTGSGNSLSTVYDGGCLDLAFGGGVAEATCQSGAASQNWARI